VIVVIGTDIVGVTMGGTLVVRVVVVVCVVRVLSGHVQMSTYWVVKTVV
jgi:hypothetical protein